MRCAASRIDAAITGFGLGSWISTLPFLVLMTVALGATAQARSELGDQVRFSRVIIDAGATICVRNTRNRLKLH